MKPSVASVAIVLLGLGSACKSSTGPSTSITINVVSGNAQTVAVQDSTPAPLVVRVVDDAGAPVADAAVAFSTAIIGTFATIPNTDANGMTQTVFTAGTKVGVDTITVTTANVTNRGVFTVTITPGPPSAIRKLAGDGQVATPGTTLSFPFVIDVKDGFHNNIKNLPVSWTTDGGTLSAAATATDSVGQTKVTLALPLAAGKLHVTAHVPGLTDAVFIATAK